MGNFLLWVETNINASGEFNFYQAVVIVRARSILVKEALSHPFATSIVIIPN